MMDTTHPRTIPIGIFDPERERLWLVMDGLRQRVAPPSLHDTIAAFRRLDREDRMASLDMSIDWWADQALCSLASDLMGTGRDDAAIERFAGLFTQVCDDRETSRRRWGHGGSSLGGITGTR